MGLWSKVLQTVPAIFAGYEVGKSVNDNDEQKEIKKEDTNTHLIIEVGLGLVLVILILAYFLKKLTSQRPQPRI